MVKKSRASISVRYAAVILLIACSNDTPNDDHAGVNGANTQERSTKGSAVPQGIVTVDTFWARGGPDSGEEMAFGILTDATLDNHLNTYLLDRATLNVRVLNKNGDLRTVIGRSGRGPGEFSRPLALQHDGDRTLYALDDVNGLIVIDTDTFDLKSSRSLKLPFSASDFCLMGNRLVVYGSHRGHPVHELSNEGELLRSFGEYQGPRQHLQHQPALNDNGKVACFPRSDIVVTTTRYFPQVSAYEYSTGQLLWRDSMPGFVPYAILTDDQSYTIGQEKDGSDKQYVLRPIDTNRVVVQSRRELSNGDQVKTCIYDVRRPRCEQVAQGFPFLVASRNGYTIALAEREYWYAALVKLRMRQR